MPKTRSLGARLRALREAKGLNLADVAPHALTDAGSVSRIERDLRDPSLAQLRAFAELYGVRLPSLLEGLDRRGRAA